MNFGLGMFSRLTRQRARRLAWRGRSSSAELEGLEPAGKAFGIHQAIGRRSGSGSREGALATGSPPIASEEMDTRGIPRGPFCGVAL